MTKRDVPDIELTARPVGSNVRKRFSSNICDVRQDFTLLTCCSDKKESNDLEQNERPGLSQKLILSKTVGQYFPSVEMLSAEEK